MTYKEYFKTFNKNDIEHVVQHVPNSKAEKFLLENAPRFYCPNADIEETFAFRTWTMRKHVKKTDAGFLLTEFLTKVQLPWAGKYNVINAPLTHHLNEFRWLKNAELKEYINSLVDEYVKENVNPNRIVLELQEIAYDRSKPLGERNKALAQLCKIYNLENMNLNVKADVNINPYENLTEEELKKLAELDDEDEG